MSRIFRIEEINDTYKYFCCINVVYKKSGGYVIQRSLEVMDTSYALHLGIFIDRKFHSIIEDASTQCTAVLYYQLRTLAKIIDGALVCI